MFPREVICIRSCDHTPSLLTHMLGPCRHDVEARNKSTLKTTLLGLFFLLNGVRIFMRTHGSFRTHLCLFIVD